MERPQTTMAAKTAFIREVDDKEYSMERLRYYLRESALSYEDAFLDVCNNAFGRTSERKVRMSREDFYRAMKRIDLPLSDVQVHVLFDLLDSNRDGYVDRSDWMTVMQGESKCPTRNPFPVESHVNYIKDVVFKYKLHTDDVLQRMNLNREHPPLDLYTLREAL